METKERLFGGDKLYMLYNSTPSQMMGYVLYDGEKVAVIDGGTYGDGEELENILLSLGGKVDTWFFTHAHLDHIGAVLKVIENGKIKVKKYCYDFLEKKENEKYFVVPEESGINEKFYKYMEETNAEKVTPKVGDVFEVGDFKFEILKNGKEKITDNFNDTSIVFKAYTKNMTILFLGDLGVEGGEYLLEKYSGTNVLSCPVCQLAHHGQSAVNEKFYKAVNMKYALWSTPTWLWNNDIGGGYGTGPFTTLETREWLKNMGVIDINAFDKVVVIE